MNLREFLATSPSCLVAGVPNPNTGVVGQAFMVDTAVLAEWSMGNAAELGAGQATFDDFVRKVAMATGPGRMQLHLSRENERAQFTANDGALLGRIGAEQAACVHNGDALYLGHRDGQRFKRRMHSLISMGLNATGNAYPAFAAYREAERFEAQNGFTKNFVAKHISMSAKGEQGKRVAQVRMNYTNDTIAILGNNVVNRSTTIDEASAAAFHKEIVSRRGEFTQTYDAMARWFVETSMSDKYIDDIGRRPTRATARIDHVTFVSKRTYKVYEYERGSAGLKPAEKEDYLQFGLAPSRDTSSWAVHHLAGTGREPGAHGTRLDALGIAAGSDEFTHILDPFA